MSLQKEIQEKAQKDFLRFTQASNTKIQVKLDKGIYRHLYVSGGLTWFEIITSPGVLIYTGDMGTFVFRRNQDMFWFFRDPKAEDLYVNPEYWAEKVEAEDNCDGMREYKPKAAYEEFLEYIKDEEDEGRQENLLEMLEEADLETQQNAYQLASEWNMDTCDYPRLGEIFTGRYLWCLYAIVWTIRQYDNKNYSVSGEDVYG